ncbi:MAG: T9SS type A sorting domain-containing protein [Flavobacteriales bacterium]
MYFQISSFLKILWSISQNFELNSLPKGIYFLNVKTESNCLVERLIIQ